MVMRLSLFMLLIALGCSSKSKTSDVCTPGDHTLCDGNGCQGERVCGQDKSWGSCVCSAADSGAGGGTNRLPGAFCKAGSECMSGYCTDGVCCNSKCSLFCRACIQTDYGSDGVCSYVSDGKDPRGECPGSSCDGKGNCK